MKLATAEALANAAHDLGMEAEVMDGYSGRSMYGRETTAVSAESMCALIAAAASAAGLMDVDDQGDFIDDLKGLRWDSLGLGVIVY